MNREALKALRASIRKYSGALEGKPILLGLGGCPLCRLYFGFPPHCSGCPIQEHTGYPGCSTTPYDAIPELFHGPEASTVRTPAQRKAVRAELKFLESLLPKQKRKT